MSRIADTNWYHTFDRFGGPTLAGPRTIEASDTPIGFIRGLRFELYVSGGPSTEAGARAGPHSTDLHVHSLRHCVACSTDAHQPDSMKVTRILVCGSGNVPDAHVCIAPQMYAPFRTTCDVFWQTRTRTDLDCTPAASTCRHSCVTDLSFQQYLRLVPAGPYSKSSYSWLAAGESGFTQHHGSATLTQVVRPESSGSHRGARVHVANLLCVVTAGARYVVHRLLLQYKCRCNAILQMQRDFA